MNLLVHVKLLSREGLEMRMLSLTVVTMRAVSLKTIRVLSSLDKFYSVFGLKLGYLLCGAAQQLSKALQGKDRTLQEAIQPIRCKPGQ